MSSLTGEVDQENYSTQMVPHNLAKDHRDSSHWLPRNLDHDTGTHSKPNQQTIPNSNQYNIISGGSQTALDHEHSYHHSLTLCRGLCPVPKHSDFITFQRLENLYVVMSSKHNHTSFGVSPGDHCMPLQMSTPGRTSDFARVFAVP
jgi:hypothetical protein